jgi:hypothetical protein
MPAAALLPAAIIGSGLIGGVSSAIGANSAASAQKSAAQQATQTQMDMFNTAKGELQPFIDAGTTGLNDLTANIDSLAAPINMDQATLEQTPGYQFALTQGLKANANSAASRGLGVSGAETKGGEAFATGLASGTYQQQFNNALANKQQALSTYLAPIQIGEGAASSLAGNATQTGSNIGQNITGAGNAQGASDIAAGNAAGGASNALVASILAQGLFGNTGGATKGIYSGTPTVTANGLVYN